jgi:hypothetical protein
VLPLPCQNGAVRRPPWRAGWRSLGNGSHTPSMLRRSVFSVVAVVYMIAGRRRGQLYEFLPMASGPLTDVTSSSSVLFFTITGSG